MRVPLPLRTCQLWGVAWGAALGAYRTRDAALHLLAKNRALVDAGLVPLPGNGHWETMASWGPAAAGALFFGLSLGLGTATLFGVWARATSLLPGRLGRVLPWAVAAVPAAALPTGDLALCLVLAAVAVAAAATQSRRGALIARAGLARRAAALALVILGLLPWATAPEGPFTRLRDRWLLSTDAGLLLDGFYYRWTLYPAECLKPLRALTQPAAAVAAEVPADEREGFCRQAAPLGILCVEDPGAAEILVRASPAGMTLERGDHRVTWPGDLAARRAAWQGLSDAADRGWALRRATAMALFFGCPLALCWLLASLAHATGAPIGNRLWGPAVSLSSAAAFSAALAAAALAGSSPAPIPAASPDSRAVEASLASEDAATRFYGVRATPSLGAAAVPLLVEALSDPVVNVRYAAAEALGRVEKTELGQRALREVLEGAEEWYVKERAYSALWRLGWRGGR